MLRKIFILTALLFALVPLSAESVGFTTDSTLSVMTKMYSTSVSYSLEEQDGGLLVTVNEFSYGEKTMSSFSFFAARQKDGSFAATKQVVQSEKDGKTIDVVIASAKIDASKRKVEVKFKPGKMPFSITLKTL